MCWPSSPPDIVREESCHTPLSCRTSIYNNDRHCLSSVMFPIHLSFTNHIYMTICLFHTLLTDLSWVFYLHIIISSGPFLTPGKGTVLSTQTPLSFCKGNKASVYLRSRMPRCFVAVLFGFTHLLPI